jgi:mono/diheme cytochrome c family protein
VTKRPPRRLLDRAPPNLAALLGGAALLGVIVVAYGQTSPSPPMSQGWTFNEQGGAPIYANVCAACHQPRAEGAIGAGAYPALAANETVASANAMITILLFGQRGMPAVGRMMTDEQVADVVNYVRSHFGNSYGPVVSAADVKAARSATKSTP